MLPTPLQMIAHLDAIVRGQDRAKRTLCKAVYYHYLSQAVRQSNGANIEFSSQHTFLIGPTGSGKTLLAKVLTAFLGVPCIYVPCASLTVEGYIGESVGDALARAVSSVPNIENLNNAIILLDELDKQVSQDTRDGVRGKAVQQELLAVLDGNKIERQTQGRLTPAFCIDTSKILFIATGAFVGLADIVAKRCGKGQIGFASNKLGTEKFEVDDPFAAVLPEDLIDFGIIPELVGRFCHFAALAPLSKENLIEILSQARGSPIHRAKQLFDLHGIELEFTQAAIEAIANQAFSREVGARGLDQLVAASVSSVDYRLPELREEGVRRISIGLDQINGAQPLMQHVSSGNYAPSLRLRELILNKTYKQLDQAATSNQRNFEEIESKRAICGFSELKGSALKWWNSFEAENSTRRQFIVKVLDELIDRSATITEFFLAYVYSNTDNIQANLYYLDVRRAWQRSGEATFVGLNSASLAPIDSRDSEESSNIAYGKKVITQLKSIENLALKDYEPAQLAIEAASCQLLTAECFSVWLKYRELQLGDRAKRNLSRLNEVSTPTIDELPKSEAAVQRCATFRQTLCNFYFNRIDFPAPHLVAERLYSFNRNFSEEIALWREALTDLSFRPSLLSLHAFCAVIGDWTEFLINPGIEFRPKEMLENFTRAFAWNFNEEKFFELQLSYLVPPSASGELRVLELVRFVSLYSEALPCARLIAEKVWGPGPWGVG